MARPDRFTPSCSSDWGARSLAGANADGGPEGPQYPARPGPEVAGGVASRVDSKLDSEPAEDLRRDFEEEYGTGGNAAEDTDAACLPPGCTPPTGSRVDLS